MMQRVSAKVPLVLDNVSQCLCPGCPVQAQSKCVAGLKLGGYFCRAGVAR